MNEIDQNFSLLVVDDEPPALRLFEDTFAQEKYDIYTASGGYEALDFIKNVKIDAVLTDLVMPGMDGLELLEKIKRISPSTMVIMITGNGGVGDAVQAIKHGADDFLEKPFSQDSLRLRISRLYKMWELKIENQNLKHRRRWTHLFEQFPQGIKL